MENKEPCSVDVERVAEAIWRAEGMADESTWDVLCATEQLAARLYREQARAAIEAMTAPAPPQDSGNTSRYEQDARLEACKAENERLQQLVKRLQTNYDLLSNARAAPPQDSGNR